MLNGLRNIKTITGVVISRLELYSQLLAVEAKIEIALLIRRLVWAITGIVFMLFALGMAHITALSYFWLTDYRMLAIVILLILDIAIASISFYLANKTAKQESFKVSKEQLAKDIEYMKESI